jgi:Spy/CpxP family protein refolding chaperone
MKQFRNLSLSGAAVAVAVLLAGNVPLVSGQGGAPDGTRGPGMRMRAMHGGMGGAPLITIALKHKSELNLSAEQTAHLEKIRDHYQAQVTPLHQQLAAIEKEVHSLSQQTPANLIGIKAKIHEGEKYRSELRYLRIEALENGKAVLTAEQQEKLKDLARSRFEHLRKQPPAQAS